MDAKKMMETFKAISDKHKMLLQTASARKGQKPHNKPDRELLAFMFAPGRELPAPDDGDRMIRQAVIGYAYPPCTVALSELKPMTVGELRLETVHRGRALFVRTFGTAFSLQAAQNAVEDGMGGVDRLAVYYTDPSLKATDVLPKGEVFAVKEPYYKISGDGGYLIRVDHPSDLLHLEKDDIRIPPILRSKETKTKSAEAWKEKGNASFKSKKFLDAARFYGLGLEACNGCETDALLRLTLHRNRAMANIHLLRFEAAHADAEAAIIPPAMALALGESAIGSNTKAYYRAGVSAYRLGNYHKAKEAYEKLLDLSPGDADGQREMQRTSERMVESLTGKYDFFAFKKLADTGRTRLDAASFYNNTAIRQTATRGRGVFATQAIGAGEIVLCEKAFVIALESDETSTRSAIINLNTDTISYGTHASRLVDSVQLLLHNPHLAEEFSQLHVGGKSQKMLSKLVDGSVPVDTFQVQAALQLNGFGCATADGGRDKEFEGSTGIWLRASAFNHDCIGNSCRAFISDLMVIRATKDIAKDEEILLTYKGYSDDHDKFRKDVQRSWGFTCKCVLCHAEGQVSSQDRKRRKEIYAQASAFLKSNQISQLRVPSAASIRQAEQLYGKLEATYTSTHAPFLPRPALTGLDLWLCQAYAFCGPEWKLRKMASAVLRNIGYDVSVSAGKATINRPHPRLYETGVHAAMYLARIVEQEGQGAAVEQLVKLAKELYKIVNGSLSGFEDRFGH